MTSAWIQFEDALAALNALKESAVDALKALDATHSDAPVFQSTYARALKDAGRPIAALNVYRQAARKWPTDSTLLHDLAVTAREGASTAAGPLAQSLREEAIRADTGVLAPGRYTLDATFQTTEADFGSSSGFGYDVQLTVPQSTAAVAYAPAGMTAVRRRPTRPMAEL